MSTRLYSDPSPHIKNTPQPLFPDFAKRVNPHINPLPTREKIHPPAYIFADDFEFNHESFQSYLTKRCKKLSSQIIPPLELAQHVFSEMTSPPSAFLQRNPILTQWDTYSKNTKIPDCWRPYNHWLTCMQVLMAQHCTQAQEDDPLRTQLQFHLSHKDGLQSFLSDQRNDHGYSNLTLIMMLHDMGKSKLQLVQYDQPNIRPLDWLLLMAHKNIAAIPVWRKNKEQSLYTAIFGKKIWESGINQINVETITDAIISLPHTSTLSFLAEKFLTIIHQRIPYRCMPFGDKEDLLREVTLALCAAHHICQHTSSIALQEKQHLHFHRETLDDVSQWLGKEGVQIVSILKVHVEKLLRHVPTHKQLLPPHELQANVAAQKFRFPILFPHNPLPSLLPPGVFARHMPNGLYFRAIHISNAKHEEPAYIVYIPRAEKLSKLTQIETTIFTIAAQQVGSIFAKEAATTIAESHKKQLEHIVKKVTQTILEDKLF